MCIVDAPKAFPDKDTERLLKRDLSLAKPIMGKRDP